LTASWPGSRVEASSAKPTGRVSSVLLHLASTSSIDVAPRPTLCVLGAVDEASLQKFEVGKVGQKLEAVVGQQLSFFQAARSQKPSSPSKPQTVAPPPELDSFGAGLVGICVVGELVQCWWGAGQPGLVNYCV
jgi:hypothetical protein